MKIIIDPGHGGSDPGAIGPSGLQEKMINLAVARQVAEIMASAAEVRLTRNTDTAVDLTSRARLANDWKADCFVSIHCNSATNSTAHGSEVFSYHNSQKGELLARDILMQLPQALGIANRGLKQANFAVLRQTRCPAALVELAFISNPVEETLLKDPAFPNKAAQAIAQGIASFLGIKLTKPALQATNQVMIQVGNQAFAGVLIDGVVYAPVRRLAETLDKKVIWDNKTRVVNIG